MTQCVAAAAAAGVLLRSEVTPLHRAQDALARGFSEPPPWSPSAQPRRGAAAPRPGEPQRSLLSPCLPAGTTGRGAGAAPVSSPLSQGRFGHRDFLRFLPSLCKLHPKT